MKMIWNRRRTWETSC